jgi:hypothetical protein
MKGIFKNVCKSPRTLVVAGIILKHGESSPVVEIPKNQESEVWAKVRAGHLKFTPTPYVAHKGSPRVINVVANTPSVGNMRFESVDTKRENVVPVEDIPIPIEIKKELAVVQIATEQVCEVKKPELSKPIFISADKAIPTAVIDVMPEPIQVVVDNSVPPQQEEEKEDPELTSEQLESYSKVQLIAMARSLGINDTKMKKTDLIEAILGVK